MDLSQNKDDFSFDFMNNKKSEAQNINEESI